MALADLLDSSKMEYDTSLADNAYELAKRWNAARSSKDYSSFSPKDTEGWTSNQVGMLLDTLTTYDEFSQESVEAVDRNYGVNASKNPEIRFRWYLFALKSGFYAQDAAVWVRNAGRKWAAFRF